MLPIDEIKRHKGPWAFMKAIMTDVIHEEPEDNPDVESDVKIFIKDLEEEYKKAYFDTPGHNQINWGLVGDGMKRVIRDFREVYDFSINDLINAVSHFYPSIAYALEEAYKY